MLSGKNLSGCPKHHGQQRPAKEKRLDCTFDVRRVQFRIVDAFASSPRPRMAISSPRGVSQTLGSEVGEV